MEQNREQCRGKHQGLQAGAFSVLLTGRAEQRGVRSGHDLGIDLNPCKLVLVFAHQVLCCYGHEGEVLRLAWAQNGSLLASGDACPVCMRFAEQMQHWVAGHPFTGSSQMDCDLALDGSKASRASALGVMRQVVLLLASLPPFTFHFPCAGSADGTVRIWKPELRPGQAGHYNGGCSM
jgi:hypothetical protein